MLQKRDEQSLICLQSNIKIKVKFIRSEVDVLTKTASTFWNQENKTTHLKIYSLSLTLAFPRESSDTKGVAKSVLIFFSGWEI